MERSFLQSYLDVFAHTQGWFSFDAALIFMTYAQLNAAHGISGNTLEIGVYHGLSSVAVAALRGEGAKFYAVDLFEDQQEKNISQAGIGNRAHFEQTMKGFYPEMEFVEVIPRPSTELTPADFPAGTFSFCHIDGGHSREETYSDLRLCFELLMPGGLVAVDDYFNPAFPGVAEGCIQFLFASPGTLKPLITGFNKVLFQKQPAGYDLNAELLNFVPNLDHHRVQMWDQPALFLSAAVRGHFDLYASTPQKLAVIDKAATRATLLPQEAEKRAHAGEEVVLPVLITNNTTEPFPAGHEVLGISYHLLDGGGRVLRYDNARTWLMEQLLPGRQETYPMRVKAPLQKGNYRLEIDLVLEGVMWFKDVGNPPALADLIVE